MITREQVADLQPGDVVEIAYDEYRDTLTRGPLRRGTDGRLYVARTAVCEPNGHVAWNGYLRLLTVVSRAPRPLYVNHPRTQPVSGDIVRDGDGDAWQNKGGRWYLAGGSSPTGIEDISDCSPLMLLWDGETGQVVPS